MLDDQWIIREVNTWAVTNLFMYANDHPNVLKIDLATDRLYANAGQAYLYGANTYDRVSYLDLIRSDRHSPYHMSLWGGIWSVDNLLGVLVPGETAQEIETEGTTRLSEREDLLVLGTRQAPCLHTNILRGGSATPEYGGYKVGNEWINGVSRYDLEQMREQGVRLK
jgi:hypothetical protein